MEGSAPLVDTAYSDVRVVVENTKIMDTPLNGRHFLQLGLLIPGVSEPQTGSTQAQWGTAGGNFGFSVAGQRDSYNDFTLDGVNVMDTNYNAHRDREPVGGRRTGIQDHCRWLLREIRHSARRAQVDIVTRSGTNNLHGSLYEYLRNSALDAKNFFDDPNAPTPPYVQNQFGATAGGPVKKDKAFFFLSYEGLRIRQSLTQDTTVPTLAMHQGNLSGINPGTGLAFPQVKSVAGVPFLGKHDTDDKVQSFGGGDSGHDPSPQYSQCTAGAVELPGRSQPLRRQQRLPWPF